MEICAPRKLNIFSGPGLSHTLVSQMLALPLFVVLKESSTSMLLDILSGESFPSRSGSLSLLSKSGAESVLN